MSGDPAPGTRARAKDGAGAVRVRVGGLGDVAEVVRLRRVMFAAMHGADAPGPWEGEARRMLAAQLAVPDPSTGVFVVDVHPGADLRRGGGRGGGGTLAACAVGTVEERLPSPSSPAGRFGFVFNVCTDPAHRGRGYGRAVTVALLDWFAARGVTRVDLHATPDAERLYRELGFAPHSTALSLDVSARDGG